jgi:hypothetical protein
MYHIPVQTIRAEKIGNSPRIENFYYCIDWNDQKKIKEKKKIPAFGTSNEKMELLYIKNYSPGLYYYSLPDWVAAMQFAISEGEISNLHLNNITNGFLPAVMLNFNNGVPAPEERETIEDVIEPYLIQQGFLQRTPRGRVATPLAYAHLGLPSTSSKDLLG